MTVLPHVGDTFGRYRIDAEIGRGGMGVVYAATDTAVERTVALKVVSSTLGDSAEFLQRFEREAATLARLDSPHVIAIYDYGTENDCPYIATQYIGGGDLGALLHNRGPMPPSLALRVASQVADALADAHRAGVVHRDVKPTNVLLRDADAFDLHAYLCDFGIARTATDGLTAPGAVAGTWSYLSPECGRGEPATPSSDVYALGCLLWACLTGAPPYQGTDVEIAVAHQRAPIPQLAGDDPTSQQLNAVLQRSMAKDPAQRYASADELRGDLLAVSGSGDVPLEPLAAASNPDRTTIPRPGEPPRHDFTPGSFPPPPAPPRPAKKRRTGLIVAGVVGALVVVGGVGTAVALSMRGDDDPTGGGGGGGGTEEAAPISGDVDGDGFGDATVALYLGTGADDDRYQYQQWLSDGTTLTAGTPEYADRGTAPTTDTIFLGTIGNFDDDGRTDVLVTEVFFDEKYLEVYGTLTGGTEIDMRVDFPDDREPYPAADDIDGDGLDDLVWLSSTDAELTDDLASNRAIDVLVAHNTGEGFDQPETLHEFPPTDNLDVVLGDFDGDGLADLVTITTPSDLSVEETTLTLWKGDGTGFEESTSRTYDDNLATDLPTAADIDGDGADELVTVRALVVDEVTVYSADLADGAWGDQIQGPLMPRYSSIRDLGLAVSDIDGDGDEDVLIAIPRFKAGAVRLAAAIADPESPGKFSVAKVGRWVPKSPEEGLQYGYGYLLGQKFLP